MTRSIKLKVFRPEGSVYIGQVVNSWDKAGIEGSLQEAVRVDIEPGWAAASYSTICQLITPSSGVPRSFEAAVDVGTCDPSHPVEFHL